MMVLVAVVIFNELLISNNGVGVSVCVSVVRSFSEHRSVTGRNRMTTSGNYYISLSIFSKQTILLFAIFL